MKLLLDEQISGKVALRGLSDPDVFELAQAQGRAVVTYNRADFEAINREYAEAGYEHHGLVIVHPVRFPSRDFARLSKALKALVDGEALGKSFTVWLQEG